MTTVEAKIKGMSNNGLMDIAFSLREQLRRMNEGLVPENPSRRRVNNSLQDKLVREWSGRFLGYLSEKYPVFGQLRTQGGQK